MSSQSTSKPTFVNLLQEFSIPLLVGVVAALLFANLAHDAYEHILHWAPFGHLSVFGHELTFHFIVNDIFMVLFFGIAAKEITEAALPGGSLNPPSKAVNPLIATLGGVFGPVLAFFGGLWLCYQMGFYGAGDEWGVLSRGWGIPTATDIALAWLVARTVFGRGHPAIDFLLLLAIADDAIGLIIIAVFYGDPANPARPEFLGMVVAAMGVAYAMRRVGVNHWVPYIAVCGPLAWSGLLMAHLHPALALVPIVPFLPGPKRDTGLFAEEDEVSRMGEELAADLHIDHSPLHMFEHQLKLLVDFGLFFFAFANAGVAFAAVSTMTWLILGSLVVGKTVGVAACGLFAQAIGFKLPDGMSVKDLVMAGFIAALGLTVALFVATEAFQQPGLQGQAKMGALFSGFVGIAAVLLGRLLGFGPKSSGASGTSGSSAAPRGDSGAQTPTNWTARQGA